MNQFNKQNNKYKWFVATDPAMTINGANDANKEAFKGNPPLDSIIRENIQNSLDAKADGEKKVKIEIALEYINTKDFPGKESLENYVNKMEKAHWKTDFDVKALISNIRNTFKKEKLPILRFSDYNTTGAEGALKYHPRYTNKWNLLTSTNYATGNSINSGSGGSYGVGKNASKICSDLSTVIYTTKSDESENVFSLGSATLASFIAENDDISSNFYTLAEQRNKKPFPYQILNLDSNYQRKEHGNGTDVYIMAFNKIDDLKQNAAKYVLSEFLVSIFFKKLSVTIKLGDTTIEINNKNLYSIIEKFAGNNDEKSLQIRDDFSTLSDGKQGRLSEKYRNRFKLGPDDGLLYMMNCENTKEKTHSTFLMTRENGMKIFYLEPKSSIQKINGIFIAQGRLSKLLKRMENVTHEKWDSEYFRTLNDDAMKVKPKQLYDGLTAEIRNFIKKNTINSKKDTIFDYMINEFVQVTEEPSKSNADNGQDTEIPTRISNVKIIPGNVKINSSKNKSGSTINLPTGTKGSGSEETSNPNSKNTNNNNSGYKNWSEISLKNDHLIRTNENTLEYFFESSNPLPKSMLKVTIRGEKKVSPTILKASYNGKLLDFQQEKENTFIFINDKITRNTPTKISLNVKEGSDIGLTINVYKEAKNNE